MNTIKTTLIAALLLFTVNAALAQDKYEYATISYSPNNAGLLGVSMNGSEFKKVELIKGEVKNQWTDVTPALKQVSKLNAEGWELFDTGIAIGGEASIFYTYSLRKKVG